MAIIRAFLRDRRGTTAIEYALIATIISIILVASLGSIGSKLNTKYIGAVASNLT